MTDRLSQPRKTASMALPVSTALGHKHHDRLELCRDADYFLTEAVTRLEQLHRSEPQARRKTEWAQAAALARRVRKHVRERGSEMRRRRKERERADRLAGERHAA